MWSRGAWVLLGLASNAEASAIKVSEQTCQTYSHCSFLNALCHVDWTNWPPLGLCQCNTDREFVETDLDTPVTIKGTQYSSKCAFESGITKNRRKIFRIISKVHRIIEVLAR